MANIMKLVLLLSLFSFSLWAENWRPLLSVDNITVYGAEETESGLIPFKAVGSFPFSSEKILHVLLDTPRKPEWSPKLDRVKVHEKISPRKYIFSEYYRTPWPATDREFLLMGEIHQKDDTITLSASNAPGEGMKKYFDEDYIQADVHYLDITLEKLEEQRTKITFRFLGHLQGWMPAWLINIIQKKWPLRFLQGLRQQLQKDITVPSKIYESYLNKQKSGE